MIDILTASIGIGLAVSLMFSEMFGLAAGGMVVPGYIALYLNRPIDIALTLAASFVTYLVVHSLSTFIIIYGKRRTVLMIIVGYLVRGAMTQIPFYSSEFLYQLSTKSPIPAEWEPIGYVIPGLIAIWMDRQGVLETLSALVTSAVVVRLVLMLVFGMELQNLGA
ncbi:MAG: poly-gamma-glutamate biosynthesis protein PgsC [Planctomycetaceae bacterium]|uniref:Capsule biosynthesis protein CapC n=1 Tax=Lacipirellula limnantheis TaxID=2528024 RepID=A0A517U3P3_9BACT|nr:poly-gamma-glutamate biosynthesis protein PgsC [Lacipirellula limnantheis]MBL9161538.1 poly-gamma-glutamate biosynthesis protein PgsC [Planctomycetaceae bacterium]QDT75233.1 Capsule biosynthesis protein CapC [Lacipirellula limnantheis]